MVRQIGIPSELNHEGQNIGDALTADDMEYFRLCLAGHTFPLVQNVDWDR
jgi:hypothetical protein